MIIICIQSQHLGAQKCVTDKLSTSDKNLQRSWKHFALVPLSCWSLSPFIGTTACKILKDKDLPDTNHASVEKESPGLHFPLPHVPDILAQFRRPKAKTVEDNYGCKTSVPVFIQAHNHNKE